MKIVLPLLILVFLFGCKKAAKETVVQGASSSESLPFRWNDNRLPLTISISTDLTFSAGDYDGAGRNPIEQMQKAWDDAIPSKTLFNYPAISAASLGIAGLESYNDTVIGVYKSDDWFSNVKSNALAITQFYAKKESSPTGDYYELSHADIIINERDHNFSYNAASTTDYDLSTVVLHEFGHLLGLVHQSQLSVAAVMQPYLSISDSNRALFANDKLRLQNNYGISALSALGPSGFVLGSSVIKSSIPDGTEYHGVIELLKSGECRHYKNGKLISSHR